MTSLQPTQLEALVRFSRALVNQEAARVIVPANQAAPGFWFGGGNMISTDDDHLQLVGRYRNAGDSRTGVAAGERGLELAIFESCDLGQSFQKVLSFEKSDLDVSGRRVLSIEGSALHRTAGGIELFVSTEKDGIGYPPGFESYLKPGTGVWTIERLAAPTVADLRRAEIETIAECNDARFVHVKDPFVYDSTSGELALLFCTHPFSWTSSNTAYQVRPAGGESFGPAVWEFFPRGVTWDVAMTRGTCLLDVPQVGLFSEQTACLMFYDGGECVRNLDEHSSAVSRPRGYSCEELGGVAWCPSGQLDQLARLSVYEPMFVSPSGTGCSRYVDVCVNSQGYWVTWQQSQPDGSQPLVLNHLSHAEAERLLS